MKIFVVFLVSAVVICSAAPPRNEKGGKFLKKRGLPEFHNGDLGGFQPSFGHFAQGEAVNYATPLISALQARAHAAAPYAAPLAVHTYAAPFASHTTYAGQLAAHAFQPHVLPAPSFQAHALQAPLVQAHSLPAHAFAANLPTQYAAGLPASYAAGLPAQYSHFDAPYAAVEKFVPQINQVPVQFRTLVKNVPVPFERQIPIDNPIYTQVENHVKIDNPVPIVRYVNVNVPIHVEQKVPVPIIKQVPRPYVQKIVNVQKVLVDEQHHHIPPQSIQAFNAPPPPQQLQQLQLHQHLEHQHHEHQHHEHQHHEHQHHQQQQQRFVPVPNQSHFEPAPQSPPFRASLPIPAPAPPSTNYGVPEHQGYH